MTQDFKILEGAFVVADAHYSHKRPELLAFLREIHSKKLSPSQLILMGDIFDALFGQIPMTHKKNEEAIELINKISLEIEVIYLEGNHDFNLKKIFPHVKTFPISLQPLACRFENKKVLLSHGDIEAPLGYRIYTAIIRSSIVLYLLRAVDFLTKHSVSKRLDLYLGKKDDCREFVGLEKFIYKRLWQKYKCDYFVEGHFHQNRTVEMGDFIYINLGAFACNQRYFIVKSAQDIELLQEKNFSKGI
ncbi:metallophosphoesterase [Sulfurimonas sp.]|uniref:UDP-2,3-diacylglucosamine diphosphatase n=1 Tax=Sulfurimonas sp. TaxID=2022749 RepID=UPI0025E51DE1|nr:metallophosphoesterase [Sulfurimonas sp.]MBW6488109.1 metallophosphoesterase [Sulfurimonas sp.]